MDEVDLGILRALIAREGPLFGGFNPRTSSSTIAERVGLDASTVRARLRRWEDAGFLRALHVLANPRLFTPELHACSICVQRTENKAAVIEALGLMDGAMDAIDHVGPWMGFGFMADSPSALARRVKSIEQLPGVDALEPPLRSPLPQPTRALTRTDARLLQAVRRDPQASMARLGESCGVSANTAQKRYSDLVAANAVMTAPELDFRRFDGGAVVRVIVVTEPDCPRGAVADALAAVGSRPLSLQGAHNDPDLPGPILSFLLHLRSVALADEIEQAARALPWVVDVELLFPRYHHVFTAWVDERLEALAAAR